MAVFYVNEFRDMARPGMFGPDSLNIPQLPQNAQQQVAIGTSSVSSAAFGQGTQYIQIHCDTSAAWTVGTAPNASAATSTRLATNETRIYSVPLNQSYKIAVIQTT